MAGAISRRANKLAQSLLAFALSAALIAEPAMAQAQDNPAAPTAPATDAEANAAEPAAGESFSRDELEKLLAPIALYPDPLLAQMLPASAYPVQIVQAQRWLDKNKALVAKNDYSGIDNQNWDPAVKALARFPDVIKTMSADLDWTTDLGDAEVNQPQDVAEVIQDLRAKAEAAGTLKTTDQQTVERVEASVPPGAGAPEGSTATQAEPRGHATGGTVAPVPLLRNKQQREIGVAPHGRLVPIAWRVVRGTPFGWPTNLAIREPRRPLVGENPWSAEARGQHTRGADKPGRVAASALRRAAEIRRKAA